MGTTIYPTVPAAQPEAEPWPVDEQTIRIDEMFARQLDTEFSSGVRALLHAPEIGIAAQRGEAALNAIAGALPALNELKQRTLSLAMGPRQRGILEPLIETRLDWAAGTLGRLAERANRHRLSLDDEDHARFAGAQKAIVEGRIEPVLARYDRLRRGVDRALKAQGVDTDGPAAVKVRADARNQLESFQTIEGRVPKGDDVDALVSRSVDASVLERENIVPVAAGDLKCVGGACKSGGSWGTTGMYQLEGKTLCRSCAIKQLGIENDSAEEIMKTLRRFPQR